MKSPFMSPSTKCIYRETIKFLAFLLGVERGHRNVCIQIYEYIFECA